MKIIEIERCEDCPHYSHTGAHKRGGAKPCCDHPLTVKLKGNNCFKRVIPYKIETIQSTDNTYRQFKVPKKIPYWCPLHDLRI